MATSSTAPAPSSPSLVDEAAFRRAMSSFASGVNIITVGRHGSPHGMTATAFCSVSSEPPLVLVCVHRDSRTHDMIDAAGAFGVSMLSTDAVEVSNHCARPGGDKVLPLEWLREDSESQTPVLDGALVHVDAELHARHEAGTHAILVGRVRYLDFGRDSSPLLYYRGAYGALADA